MKILLAVISFWILLTAASLAEEPQITGAPFAVVELFVSEGCSDCPPADAFLSQLITYARNNAKRIYTLSFQVDYWNYLGWQDPYSSAQFTERQSRYAQVLPGGVYTPEMIINGKEAFIGSDKAKAQGFIDHYLGIPSENNIILHLDQSGNELKIDYRIAKPDPQAVINFALVERGLISHVTAGENGGRTLAHDNVVREFKTIDPKNVKGKIFFPKPQANDLTRFSVIAFIQSKRDMAISAASQIDLK